MQNPAAASARQARIAFRPVAIPRSTSRGGGAAKSYAADLLCFAIPFANFISVTLIGDFPLGEIVTLAAIVPCMFLAWKRIWRGYNKTIFVLMGLWFVSQLVTDFYRHSPFGLMARGLAAISFFAIDLAVLSALAYRKPRRVVFLVVGQAAGLLLAFLLDPNSQTGFDAVEKNWKFGYAPFMIPAVVLLACYFYGKRHYWVAFPLLISIAGENLLQNYRSEMLIIMAASMLAFPLTAFERQVNQSFRGRNADPQRRKFPVHSMVLLALVLVVGVATTKTYSYLASKGSLGDRAQEKYEEQSRGKFGLLAGGRPETLISWRAVADSPILGHGSWAEDRKYTEMFADIIRETGYADEDSHPIETASDIYLIPAHSYLMSAWVWAGFLGALFWFYVLYLTGKAVLELAREQVALSPYIAYLLLGEFWRVLFSPFGHTVRMDQAIVLVIICSLIEGTSGMGSPVRLFGRPARMMQSPRRLVPYFH